MRHRFISNSKFKRNYKVFPSKYTVEDYFKGPQEEKFDSDEIIEATIMKEEVKTEWVKSLIRQENEFKTW